MLTSHSSRTSQTAALFVSLSCFLLCFLEAMSFSTGLTNDEICTTLEVGHPTDPPFILPNNSLSIQLIDVESGESKQCYVGNREYSISIRSNYKSIKGLVFVKSREDLGYFTSWSDELELLLCGDLAISHRYHELKKHDLTRHVSIKYNTSESGAALQFKYSIVFTYAEFLAAQTVTFFPCGEMTTATAAEATTTAAEATTTTTTVKPKSSPSPFCNATDFVVKMDTKASRKCRNWKWNVTPENRNITRDGVQYECIYNDDDVQRKECTSSCRKGGNNICCRLRANETVFRNFRCLSKEAEQREIVMRFGVLHQRRCDCYKCSDVCPAHPNSTENDYDNSDPETNSENHNSGHNGGGGGDNTEEQNSV